MPLRYVMNIVNDTGLLISMISMIGHNEPGVQALTLMKSRKWSWFHKAKVMSLSGIFGHAEIFL